MLAALIVYSDTPAVYDASKPQRDGVPLLNPPAMFKCNGFKRGAAGRLSSPYYAACQAALATQVMNNTFHLHPIFYMAFNILYYTS